MNSADVIVLGLGVIGTAIADALAGRGFRVIGFDQFPAGHDRGSSHGHSRIIRTAYFEHPDYVPYCRSAFAAWYDLECDAGRPLLINTPCLSIGPPGGELIAGVSRAAADHELSVTPLSPDELRREFPQFHFGDEWCGLVEFDAGILLADDCVRELRSRAERRGAVLQFETPVHGWSADGRVTVQTAQGIFSSDQLVIAAGPWAVDHLDLPLTVMRQVPMWFAPDEPARFRRGAFPVFIAETARGDFYGIPALDGRGPKIARHYGSVELPGPAAVAPEVTDDDERPVREFLARHLPGVGPRTAATVCRYTLTPDRHFILDRHPDLDSVVIAAGFSGHGFKFAPVVGSLVAEVVSGGRAPGELFSARRFGRFR